MSNMLVCDVCGRELTKPYYKFRATKHEDSQESRDAKQVGTFDMHEQCVKLFKAWMTDNRIKEQSR
jgi:hypothetical protein